MSPFFGKNLPEWTDMSDFVVHFTKKYGGKSAYENMLSILASKVIKARNAFGIAKSISPAHESQKTVCFSEVPLHRLSRLAKARSDYGIVFRKDSVIHRKGNPILYAYKDHPVLAALKQLAKSGHKDPKNPIWTITPFVDAPGMYAQASYFFEWEREWRKVGDYKFELHEVEFLIIPKKLHNNARAFFDNAKADNLGPSYNCPFIDPYWKLKKLKPLLAKYATLD
jgi:hypothetical protein